METSDISKSSVQSPHTDRSGTSDCLRLPAINQYTRTVGNFVSSRFIGCQTVSSLGSIGTRARSDEVRLILMGRTGSGKSATGNTILGNTTAGDESITTKCKISSAMRDGRAIYVVDTPGLFDTGMTQAELTKEVTKCFAMSAPGPHAVVLVIPADRFTREDLYTLTCISELLGPRVMRYLFVLFTGKDQLDAERVNLETFVRNVPTWLQILLRECNNRYAAFNNRGDDSEKESQVRALLNMIDNNLRSNGGRYFSNEMFVEAEAAMIEREMEIRKLAEVYKRQEVRQLELKHQRKRHVYVSQAETLRHKLRELKNPQGMGQIIQGYLHFQQQSQLREQGMELELIKKLRELDKQVNSFVKDAREIARKEIANDSENQVWKGLQPLTMGIARVVGKLFQRFF